MLGGRLTADAYARRGRTIAAKDVVCGDYVRSTVAKCMKRGGRAKRMPDVHKYLGDLSAHKPGAEAKPNHPIWPGLYFHVGMQDKDKNGPIRLFQSHLKWRGWEIDVDGRFGTETEKVVKKFQQQKHLDADGEVGPATWQAIWASPVTKG